MNNTTSNVKPSRANKTTSTITFLPKEYAGDVDCLEPFLEYVKQHHSSIDMIMFLVTVKVLEYNNEIKVENISNILTYQFFRTVIKAIITEWFMMVDVDHNIYDLIIVSNEGDFLGLVYQSLLSGGKKSKLGSFYTPKNLVVDSLTTVLTNHSTDILLDPCCGSGQYLLVAAKQFELSIDRLVGFDNDPIAIQLAKINLLLHFKEYNFCPRLYHVNTLSESELNQLRFFDNVLDDITVIATNPPWGNIRKKEHYEGEVKSNEMFSMFIERAIQLLPIGGKASFIIPESFLSIKIHADIRFLLLSQCKIINIELLGRPFTNVFTSVIRIDFIKEITSNDLIMVNGFPKIKPSHVLLNKTYIFDIHHNEIDRQLIDKFYQIKHLTLENNAQWALGIVTGDNKSYVVTHKNRTRPIITGPDISKYKITLTKYIIFKPKEFNQIAKDTLYKTEKLVYKFISNKLIFAYDNKGLYMLNSANALIPNMPGISIKVTLAFLNSMLFQYIFMKKFSTIKVLKGDLEQLPFPMIDTQTHSILENLVDKTIAGIDCQPQINEMIFNIFQCSEHEIKYINETIKVNLKNLNMSTN